MFHHGDHTTSELKSLPKSPKVESPVETKSHVNVSSLDQRDHHTIHYPSTTKSSVDQISISHNMQQHRTQRPLTTYTSLGSPIHRPRKMSLGANDNAVSSLVLQSRPRSNSHSVATIGGVPALFLPGQLPYYNEMTYTTGIPAVDVRTKTDDVNLNAPSRTLMTSDLSDCRDNTIEAAYAFERKREMELEKEEEHMTADELRIVLKRERARMAKIQSDLAITRHSSISLHPRHFPAEELVPSDEGRIQHGSTQRKRKCHATELLEK